MTRERQALGSVLWLVSQTTIARDSTSKKAPPVTAQGSSLTALVSVCLCPTRRKRVSNSHLSSPLKPPGISIITKLIVSSTWYVPDPVLSTLDAVTHLIPLQFSQIQWISHRDIQDVQVL